VDKPERTQSQVLLGSLGTKASDPDHVALNTAVAVFGGTFTSRLMKEVRSKRGWSYGASARLSLEKARHSFAMWTFPAAKDTPPCVELELELLRSFVTEGITERELAFIRNYLTRSYAFEIDTAQKRLMQRMDVDLLALPPDYYSGYCDHVRAVSREQSNEAVRCRLSVDDLLIVVVGTARDSFDAVQKACRDLSESTVVPFDRD
jgi:zinc protease